jgi:hypothetical protein
MDKLPAGDFTGISDRHLPFVRSPTGEHLMIQGHLVNSFKLVFECRCLSGLTATYVVFAGAA